MTPRINSLHAKTSISLLFLVTACVLGLITWYNEIFYVVFPQESYLFAHTLFEFISGVISFSIFIVAWYSWKQAGSTRDKLISATFLAVGMFDLAHMLSYCKMPMFITPNCANKAAVFWVMARLTAAGGLLITAVAPVQREPGWFIKQKLIIYTFLAALMAIAYVMLYLPVLPPLHIQGIGQTPYKILLEYLSIAINVVTFYAYGCRNTLHRHVYYLQIALVFSIVSELACIFSLNVFDSYSFVCHFYKVIGYCFILRALFEIAIVRPYTRLFRLAGTLRNLSTRNTILCKQARESHQLLRHTFIQLGETMASKNNLQEIFGQIIRSVASIFDCQHVYLCLADEAQMLKIAAYVSSFTPPDLISTEESFMGRILIDNKIKIINNIKLYPKCMVSAIRDAGLSSMVGVPINSCNVTIGVLVLFSKQMRAFDMADALLLNAFAQHVGEAIHNVGLYEKTIESYEQLSLHYDIVRNIAVETSASSLLTTVTEKLYSLLKVDGAVSFIMHHRNDGLHTEPVFIRNFSTQEVNHLQRMFSRDNTAWPWSNSADEQFNNGEQPAKAATISILMRKRLEILPLQTGGTLQGLIVFAWHDASSQLSPGMEMTLRTVAAHTAIALERTYLYENVKEMALTDALTKLANRRQFDISLLREMNRTRSFVRTMCLLMIDIDFFKKVNDYNGHLVGDAVLQQIGAHIKRHFRDTDIPSRYGGEEFAIILPETTQAEAVELAEDFRRKIESVEFDTGDECIYITISIGIAVFHSHMAAIANPGDFVEVADQALYMAKQGGRNRVVVFSKSELQ